MPQKKKEGTRKPPADSSEGIEEKEHDFANTEDRLSELRLQLLELELALDREEENEKKDGFSWHQITHNPAFLALLGVLITAMVGLFTTMYQLNQNRSLEKEKFRSELITKVIESTESEERLKGLQFLVEAGLINDPEDKIINLREDQIPKLGEAQRNQGYGEIVVDPPPPDPPEPPQTSGWIFIGKTPNPNFIVKDPNAWVTKGEWRRPTIGRIHDSEQFQTPPEGIAKKSAINSSEQTKQIKLNERYTALTSINLRVAPPVIKDKLLNTSNEGEKEIDIELAERIRTIPTGTELIIEDLFVPNDEKYNQVKYLTTWAFVQIMPDSSTVELNQ